jgi:hypothetical protein
MVTCRARLYARARKPVAATTPPFRPSLQMILQALYYAKNLPGDQAKKVQ